MTTFNLQLNSFYNNYFFYIVASCYQHFTLIYFMCLSLGCRYYSFAHRCHKPEIK